MSIENTLERIASSLEKIAKTLEHTEHYNESPVANPVVHTKVQDKPVTVPAVPVQAAAPAVPAPVVPSPAATPVPPATTPSACMGAAPFTDAKGLMAYCMEKYKSLGPTKGGMIQNVLLEMGVNNLSALTPAQYGEFVTRVEAL